MTREEINRELFHHGRMMKEEVIRLTLRPWLPVNAAVSPAVKLVGAAFSLIVYPP
jgi:hypothetical protein